MVHGRARIHGWDGDSVGRVKRDGGESSRRLGSQERKTWRRRRLDGGRARVDIGESRRARRARGFDRFDLKIGGESHQRGVQEGLIGLATKPGDEFGVAGWHQVGGCVASSQSLHRDEAKS
uniref:Uncharacterized protein n=1 Tax=Setaria viridis TaxID=4556 RepID=A0A4U6V2S4_SETVI|nr:hypothetical protein SEVIR_4G244200v2 [Setaria viridis]